jgi:hypothetical protein
MDSFPDRIARYNRQGRILPLILRPNYVLWT